jgi:L,D-transpeptidase ErfK/SrfK
MSALAVAFLFFAQILGGEFIHTVQPEDSLTSIAARSGVDARVLAEENGLKTPDRLQPGQTLKVNNRHIAPMAAGFNIVINVPQRILFYFDGDQITCACPIAAGKPGWRTPLGEFEILTKEEKPTWDVPVSIQEEMRRNGKPVLTHVPPSPENPLGEYWIGLSLSGIGIHGTNAPTSIYKLATHGCIRLHADNIRTLFAKVHVGMRGRIIYEPVLIARDRDSIFLEVHPDRYNRVSDSLGKVLNIAREEGFLDALDLQQVKDVIRKRDGIARDVTRR